MFLITNEHDAFFHGFTVVSNDGKILHRVFKHLNYSDSSWCFIQTTYAKSALLPWNSISTQSSWRIGILREKSHGPKENRWQTAVAKRLVENGNDQKSKLERAYSVFSPQLEDEMQNHGMDGLRSSRLRTVSSL